VTDPTRRDALLVLAAATLAGCRRRRPPGPADAPWPEPRPASARPRATTLTRVVTGDDGRSHFADTLLPARMVRPGVTESDPLEAATLSFRAVAEDAEIAAQPRHTAPQRQLAVVLAGELEVECADGAKRRFGSGTVVLFEDTRGEGHVTRVVKRPCTFVQVELR
jgi:hypothetical protein